MTFWQRSDIFDRFRKTVETETITLFRQLESKLRFWANLDFLSLVSEMVNFTLQIATRTRRQINSQLQIQLYAPKLYPRIYT